MKQLIKAIAILAAFATLSAASFARNIYGYIGFGPSWLGTYVPCTVDLYREDGAHIGRTRSYYHPFGLTKARYHFSGSNIGYGRHYVVVRPDALYRSSMSATFRTEWAVWSDTKAPNVRVQ